MNTSISTGFKWNGIHVIDSEWQIQDGGISFGSSSFLY